MPTAPSPFGIYGNPGGAPTPSVPSSSPYGIYGSPTTSIKPTNPLVGGVKTPSELSAFNDAATPVTDDSTGTRIVRGVENTVHDFAHNLYQTYLSTPSNIASDVGSATPDIEQGGSIAQNHSEGSFRQGLTDTMKGVVKAGARTAGDAANAIFAPFSSAIGAVLQNAGGQTLTNGAGQTIADKSGITDLPAFQKFAMSHPNASADFNKALMLLMSGGEGGEVSPEDVANHVKTAAQKLTVTDESGGGNGTKVSIKPRGGLVLPIEDQSPNETTVPNARQYIPPSELPTIEAGTKPNVKDTLPTIQSGESTDISGSKAPGYTYESVKEPTLSPIQRTDITPTEATSQAIPESARTTASPTVDRTTASPDIQNPETNLPIKTGNDTAPSKSVTMDNVKSYMNASDYEAFQQDTSHEQVNRLEQINKANDFVAKNPDVADNVIFKGAATPEGFLTQDIFTAGKAKALSDYKAGKISFEDYHDYVRANVLKGSRSAQELGARQSADRNDPETYLTKAENNLKGNDVNEGKSAEKAKQTTVTKKAVKEGVTLAVKKLIDYQKIIDSIPNC